MNQAEKERLAKVGKNVIYVLALLYKGQSRLITYLATGEGVEYGDATYLAREARDIAHYVAFIVLCPHGRSPFLRG